METVLFSKKDRFKFSCAHFTVFPDGSKERLHGHNYRAWFEFELGSTAFQEMVPFSELKKILTELCAALDERVLLPGQNPFVVIEKPTTGQVQCQACGDAYSFPEKDVVVLEKTENIDCENLSRYLASSMLRVLKKELSSKKGTALTVYVSEIDGQGAYSKVLLGPT